MPTLYFQDYVEEEKENRNGKYCLNAIKLSLFDVTVNKI